jgi:excisionase family DNA binding protein
MVAGNSELFTREEGASFVGISVSYLDKLWERRELRRVKIGRRVYYTKSELERFIKDHQQLKGGNNG